MKVVSVMGRDKHLALDAFLQAWLGIVKSLPQPVSQPIYLANIK
ncbi:MAG: hypothetical protein P8N51_14955 [Pseudomonadales bacterium]|nr:hypothetical protein [Pseudomonadales bacterium]MDG1441322.1 hypothetical protein [Pseudomonadales bacterium]